MTAADLKIASATFLLVTISVAVNLLAMQEQRDARAIETSSSSARTAEPAAGWEMSNGSVATPAPDGTQAAQSVQAAAVQTNGMPDVVRGIQRELNTRGYSAGPPDGVAGFVTRAAIMAYEYDYGLPLTGGATQDLLSRIVLGSSAPSSSKTLATRTAGHEADAVIKSVKQQLAARGYAVGPIDGATNDQLARAIREFEIDQKLPESGRISGPLVSRLTRLQAQPAVAPVAKVKPATR